jgi:hypothetical protein
MADHGRPSAYADLLAALLAVRSDPATARFDAELAQAEARGAIDGATARTLRWWQRESLRGLSDHLAAVMPDLLDHLSEAQRDAQESVEASATSWSDATARSEPGAEQVAVHDVPSGGSHLRPVDDVAGPAARPLPPAPRLLRPGFAPPESGPEAHLTRGTGASRPRLLVSGRNVRTEALAATPSVDLTDPRPPVPSAEPRPSAAPVVPPRRTT